jgi:AmmeMemoRadiSam system protein A
MLTHDERRSLLRLAREVLEHYLAGAPAPAPVRLEDASRHSGAFVTLHVGGELRGCIGYPGSPDPLDQVVTRCAIAAATEDPRFPPLEAGELRQASIEISVLTPLVPVADVSEIEVGRDGLVMEQGYRRGLLLPQVATEYRWDRDTFLSHTCLKAGLPAHAWKSGARIFKFQAEVFAEDERR